MSILQLSLTTSPQLSFSKTLSFAQLPIPLTQPNLSSPLRKTLIRMGGGPRTYPGGVSKWQWKRMQAKKSKQLLQARLSRERQIYEMRKRAELKAAVSELERPWETVEKPPNLFSVGADEQLKVLADRFQKPGGLDLWSERDGPELFREDDNGLGSVRFFPKGVVHSVKPYRRVGELSSGLDLDEGEGLGVDETSLLRRNGYSEKVMKKRGNVNDCLVSEHKNGRVVELSSGLDSLDLDEDLGVDETSLLQRNVYSEKVMKKRGNVNGVESKRSNGLVREDKNGRVGELSSGIESLGLEEETSFLRWKGYSDKVMKKRGSLNLGSRNLDDVESKRTNGFVREHKNGRVGELSSGIESLDVEEETSLLRRKGYSEKVMKKRGSLKLDDGGIGNVSNVESRKSNSVTQQNKNVGKGIWRVDSETKRVGSRNNNGVVRDGKRVMNGIRRKQLGDLEERKSGYEGRSQRREHTSRVSEKGGKRDSQVLDVSLQNDGRYGL